MSHQLEWLKFKGSKKNVEKPERFNAADGNKKVEQ